MERSVSGLHNPPLRDDEVREYHIHVSSKYLELTKKKLELTRLPHEVVVEVAEGEEEAREQREWELGVPKGVVEPLVDYWLETYTWRDREAHFNSSLPQFRTALKIPGQDKVLRLHFVHLRSENPNAIPLLLIPSFPLTNLSVPKELLNQLAGEGFHVVVPSLPGLGFSDAFLNEIHGGVLEKTAELLDGLMVRLGYQYYLCSATGTGRDSPAGIDYYLPGLIGERYRDHCLGVHVIEPCVERPRDFLRWTKFALAEFFHAGIWGYQASDFVALKRSNRARPTNETGRTVAGMLGLREPHTIAYALCDSPVGLLGLVTSALKRRTTANSLTDEEVIDITQLAWLPGPEAGMRFWSSAEREVKGLKEVHRKSRAAVSVFSEGNGDKGYIPPAWAEPRHEVVWSRRIEGKATGLILGEVVVEGVKGLATSVRARDARLRVQGLQEVVVDGGNPQVLSEVAEEDGEVVAYPQEVESPDTVVGTPLGS